MEITNPAEFRKYILYWRLINLWTKKPSSFNGTQGYVVKVFEDKFEFGEVTNAYEHFSNISDPPILKETLVKFEDIIKIKVMPWEL